MDIEERLQSILTTPMLTEPVTTMTTSLKPSAWVSSACSNTAFTEEMSGSKFALKRVAMSNYQSKNPAGAMSMTMATCMPTLTPTKPLMVTLPVPFAPNTMPSSMIPWMTLMQSLRKTLTKKMRTKMMKMVKMRRTMEKTPKTSTGTEPCNDEGANLSFVTLYNYLKQF